jgi:hypothetical protein
MWVLAVLGAVAAVVLVAYVVALFYFQGVRRSGEPPFIFSFVPYAGVMFSLGAGPVQFMRTYAKRTKSPIFSALFQGYRTHFIADPMYLATIHRQKHALSFQEVIISVANAFDIRGSAVRRLDTVTVHRDIQQHLQVRSMLAVFVTHVELLSESRLFVGSGSDDNPDCSFPSRDGALLCSGMQGIRVAEAGSISSRS